MSRSLTKLAFSKFIIHFFDFLSLKATLGIFEKSFFSSRYRKRISLNASSPSALIAMSIKEYFLKYSFGS